MNNQERNEAVKEKITQTVLRLMETKSLDDISVCEITKGARVGRASFYRNYESKKDVLCQYDRKLVADWATNYEKELENEEQHRTIFVSLFKHYKEHSDFYMLLWRGNLTDIILKTITEQSGPKPEMVNGEAYSSAFLAYGIYGWIMEWFNRGMQENPEEIALKVNGLA